MKENDGVNTQERNYSPGVGEDQDRVGARREVAAEDVLEHARRELRVETVGHPQVGVHLGLLDHDSGEPPRLVAREGGHHRVPVHLLVLGRVEAVEVVPLLQQGEAEDCERAAYWGGIVGPGGREDAVPAAGGLVR